MRKWFFSWCLRLFGWKILGQRPPFPKYVITIAPHTSNWDFFVGLAARHALDIKSYYLAKKSLFDIPLVGWFLKLIGGVPVDRSKRTNLVDQVVELYQEREKFVITVTPEGTRSYNPDWKTGFHRIAKKANVPIVMIGFDYRRKVVEVKESFMPGDLEKDIARMKAYYRTITGRNAENGVR